MNRKTTGLTKASIFTAIWSLCTLSVPCIASADPSGAYTPQKDQTQQKESQDKVQIDAYSHMKSSWTALMDNIQGMKSDIVRNYQEYQRQKGATKAQPTNRKQSTGINNEASSSSGP